MTSESDGLGSRSRVLIFLELIKCAFERERVPCPYHTTRVASERIEARDTYTRAIRRSVTVVP